MKRALLLLFMMTVAQAEEVNCLRAYLDTKRAIREMRTNVKWGRDINDEFEIFQKFSEELKQCPQYKSDKNLKVSDNEIAGWRKHIHAYDRSADISETQCKEIKLNTVNMPKKRNQGPLNWCFAFSAADLLSYHEQTPLSPYDIALQNHNNDEIRQMAIDAKIKDLTQAGGWPAHAIVNALLSDKGVCLEEEVFASYEEHELSTLIKDLADPKKDFITILCEQTLGSQQPLVSLPPKIIDILNKLSGDKKVAALMDLTCKRHKFQNQYSTYSLTNDNIPSEKLMGNVDALLRKGLPVSIGYPAELLDSGLNFVGKKADHASTVIGRKFNKKTGECEYLIRNSWGSKDVCQRTATIRCEEGNFWVPRTALKNNLFEIMWIEKKRK